MHSAFMEGSCAVLTKPHADISQDQEQVSMIILKRDAWGGCELKKKSITAPKVQVNI